MKKVKIIESQDDLENEINAFINNENISRKKEKLFPLEIYDIYIDFNKSKAAIIYESRL